MPARLRHLFSDDAANVRGRVIGIYTLLAAGNLAAWAWAFAAFHRFPLMLGTALLAYGLGVRHAIDADHIAAS
jgi:high-affinity nickel-transport protein